VAQYTCVFPAAGTLCTGVAVSASDTISGNDVNAGAMLVVTVGGTPTNVTIVDPGRTPAGNTGTQAAQTVAANTSRAWGPATLAKYIDSTGVVTVTYSSITGATAMLLADGD
jgi:hypothetical protein